MRPIVIAAFLCFACGFFALTGLVYLFLILRQSVLSLSNRLKEVESELDSSKRKCLPAKEVLGNSEDLLSKKMTNAGIEVSADLRLDCQGGGTFSNSAAIQVTHNSDNASINWDASAHETEKKSSGQICSTELGASATEKAALVECVPEGYRMAGEVLNDIRKKMDCIFKEAAEKIQSGNLPLYGWARKEKILILPKETDTQKWFFIGDIHGDFLALHRLLERAKQEKDFRVCFLGDLVDRGPCDLECFALLLQSAMDNPDRILWLAGNHDEGIFYLPGAGEKFASSVEPAEFLEILNTQSQGKDTKAIESWGRLFIDTVEGLPRAALFPDGLLATHGGVPLEDRWSNLKSLVDLEDPKTLGDFTWTRATTKPYKKGWQYDPAKRKTSSNFEFGYKDLEGFCKSVESFFPVKRLVRGHDHVESGWESPKEYRAVPILTLNGFGFHYLSGSYENYADGLLIGVYRKDQEPETDFVTFLESEHKACSPYSNLNAKNI